MLPVPEIQTFGIIKSISKALAVALASQYRLVARTSLFHPYVCPEKLGGSYSTAPLVASYCQ